MDPGAAAAPSRPLLRDLRRGETAGRPARLRRSPREGPGARGDLGRSETRSGAGLDSLLVDEFQDTDPVQVELVSRLAGLGPPDEHRPGSIFLVGDPKQSIYRFRRADIESYQEARRRLLALGDDAAREALLVANFRSDPAILDFVNGLFRPIFEAGCQAEARGRRSGEISPPARGANAAVGRSSCSFRGGVERSARVGEARPGDRGLRRRRANRRAARTPRHPGPERRSAAAARRRRRPPLSRPLRRRDLRGRPRPPEIPAGSKGGRALPPAGDRRGDPCAPGRRVPRRGAVGLRGAPTPPLLDSPCPAPRGPQRLRASTRPPKSSTPASRRGRRSATPCARCASCAPSGTGALSRRPSTISSTGPGSARLSWRAATANGPRGILEALVEVARGLSAAGPASFGDLVETLRRNLEEETEESEATTGDTGEGQVQLMSIHKSKGLEFPWSSSSTSGDRGATRAGRSSPGARPREIDGRSWRSPPAGPAASTMRSRPKPWPRRASGRGSSTSPRRGPASDSPSLAAHRAGDGSLLELVEEAGSSELLGTEPLPFLRTGTSTASPSRRPTPPAAVRPTPREAPGFRGSTRLLRGLNRPGPGVEPPPVEPPPHLPPRGARTRRRRERRPSGERDGTRHPRSIGPSNGARSARSLRPRVDASRRRSRERKGSRGGASPVGPRAPGALERRLEAARRALAPSRGRLLPAPRRRVDPGRRDRPRFFEKRRAGGGRLEE